MGVQGVRRELRWPPAIDRAANTSLITRMPALSLHRNRIADHQCGAIEDKIDRVVEVTAVLEKDGRLFRKKILNRWLYVVLRRRRIQLGEIRIDGGIEDHHPSLNTILVVQAAAWFKSLPE